MDVLHVANAGNDSITMFAQNANGNAAPIAEIDGSKTGLHFNGNDQLSQDAAANFRDGGRRRQRDE